MQLELFKIDKPDTVEGEEVYECRKCKQMLPHHHFNISTLNVFRDDADKRHTGRGMSVCCKTCKKEYGKGKYLAFKKAPPKPKKPTACGCCGVVTEPSSLFLDHDHTTYKFRGWVCRGCNSGIGNLGDNLEGLEKAIAYLKRTSNE